MPGDKRHGSAAFSGRSRKAVFCCAAFQVRAHMRINVNALLRIMLCVYGFCADCVHDGRILQCSIESDVPYLTIVGVCYFNRNARGLGIVQWRGILLIVDIMQ